MSAQGIDERMINIHYYYYTVRQLINQNTFELYRLHLEGTSLLKTALTMAGLSAEQI